ncbi:MAG: DUF2177 family protein [bacterium]
MKELLLYISTVPIFFAIDMLWIGVIAKDLYFKTIPGLSPQPNWFAAIIFYLLYIIGILIFAVLPNLDKGWQQALIYGALFGFFAYATYDLTNYAVMKSWPLSITLIDLAWGTTLTGMVATASYFIGKKIF